MLKSGKYHVWLLGQVFASLLFYFGHPVPVLQWHRDSVTLLPETKALSFTMHGPWGGEWRLSALQIRRLKPEVP